MSWLSFPSCPLYIMKMFHCRQLGILLIMGIVLIVVSLWTYLSTTCNSNNTNRIKSIKFYIWPQVLDMKFTIDALEKERDWYFRKLQTIVVWLRTKCALYWIIVSRLQANIVSECDAGDGRGDGQAGPGYSGHPLRYTGWIPWQFLGLC